MKSPDFIYNIEGKDYNVFVTKKRQRNIYFRYREDGFHISAPFVASKSSLVNGLNKYGLKLIKSYSNSNSNYSFEDDFIYLLGERYILSTLNIVNNEELQRFLKKKALEFITNLVREKEKIMGIQEPYKITVRNTKTRYGSNSMNTHHLTFQLNLIHYSPEIIETVVVHELAHDKYRNHQKEFYNEVLKYCPNYRELTEKLKKGVHKWLKK